MTKTLLQAIEQTLLLDPDLQDRIAEAMLREAALPVIEA